ncbi:MAG: hypothetical protein ACK4GM_02320 [Tabrizicola sp.]
MRERLVAIANVALEAIAQDNRTDGWSAERGSALRAALMRVAALAQAAGGCVTPERRPSETCTVIWRGQEIAVTAEFRPGTGAVIDVTARGWRAGADLQCLADDACGVISAALQRGVSVADLCRLAGSTPVLCGGAEVDEPVSVIGAILRGLEQLERAS